MHHRLRYLLLLVTFVFTAPFAHSQDETPLRIVLIGDSTMATYAKPRADKPGLTGWGQVFGEYFKPSAQVLNRASSGRSSKSFRKEGLWDKALKLKPDFVFIQFGHNDSPGKGDRSTDPQGDFQEYLTSYIGEARQQGAEPILVTPMTRRRFKAGKINTALGPYAAAMRSVGEAENVPVVDLHRRSIELFNELGEEKSAELNVTADDRTHFSQKGAHAMAGLVVQEIRKLGLTLCEHLK